jgi:hypothetical protein
MRSKRGLPGNKKRRKIPLVKPFSRIKCKAPVGKRKVFFKKVLPARSSLIWDELFGCGELLEVTNRG